MTKSGCARIWDEHLAENEVAYNNGYIFSFFPINLHIICAYQLILWQSIAFQVNKFLNIMTVFVVM